MSCHSARQSPKRCSRGVAAQTCCGLQAKEGEGASGSDSDADGAAAGADGDGGGEAALTAEEVVLKEMEALREREVAEAKRTRKKRRELKKRAKIRLAQSAATSGIGEDVDEGEEAMFTLGQVRGAKGLAAAGARSNQCDSLRDTTDPHSYQKAWACTGACVCCCGYASLWPSAPLHGSVFVEASRNEMDPCGAVVLASCRLGVK